MEQNKGKGNDTLENGLEDYCKTTIETRKMINRRMEVAVRKCSLSLNSRQTKQNEHCNLMLLAVAMHISKHW